MAIARKAGWPTRPGNRGSAFDLPELWVEGAFMIEVLDPARTAHDRTVVTPQNWKQFLKSMQAA